jgi:hypothetical protein
MCRACYNGKHRAPDAPACDVILDGRGGKVCECPCHLPKKLQQYGAPKQHKGPAPEQTSFNAGLIPIGPNS